MKDSTLKIAQQLEEIATGKRRKTKGEIDPIVSMVCLIGAFDAFEYCGILNAPAVPYRESFLFRKFEGMTMGTDGNIRNAKDIRDYVVSQQTCRISALADQAEVLAQKVLEEPRALPVTEEYREGMLSRVFGSLTD